MGCSTQRATAGRGLPPPSSAAAVARDAGGSSERPRRIAAARAGGGARTAGGVKGASSGTGCRQRGATHPPNTIAKGASAGCLPPLAAVRRLCPQRARGGGHTISSPPAPLPQSLPKLAGSTPPLSLWSATAPPRTDHPPTLLRPQSSPTGGLNPRFAVVGRVAVGTAATFVEARRPRRSLPTRRQSATATGPPDGKDRRLLARRHSFSGTETAPGPGPWIRRRVAGGRPHLPAGTRSLLPSVPPPLAPRSRLQPPSPPQPVPWRPPAGRHPPPRAGTETCCKKGLKCGHGASRNLQTSPTIRMNEFQSLQAFLRFFATTVLAGPCSPSYQLETHGHRPVRPHRIWGHRLEAKCLVGVFAFRVGTARIPQGQAFLGFGSRVETLPECQCVP